MRQVNDFIRLDEETDFRFDFVRAAGPGGQHVNKVATAVQLRFDVRNCPRLPDWVKPRLLKEAGRRATRAGEIVIAADRFRSRDRNREDAVERLIALVRKAARRDKKRIPSRPGPGAKRRRLDAKKRRGATKALRARIV